MKKLFNSKAKIIAIAGVIILVIFAFTAFMLSKSTNTDQIVVKMDIPEIKNIPKGSFVDIFIPYNFCENEQEESINSRLLSHPNPPDFLSYLNSDNILTLLPDNKALDFTPNVDRNLIFDFKKKIIIKIASNKFCKNNSIKTILFPNGIVYIFGDIESKKFDYKTQQSYPIASMLKKRRYFTATLLPDKKILITGGLEFDPINKFSDAEIYDPKLNKYTAISNMYAKRAGHTATLLKNGKVLNVGGNSKNEPYAELYDYKTGKFHPLENNGKTRSQHSATLLSDGRVLIIAGREGIHSLKDFSDIEIFDPETNVFSDIGNLKTSKGIIATTLVLKTNKIFILADRSSNIEIYSLKNKELSIIANKNLSSTSAIVLEDGNVLIINNRDICFNRKNRIKLYIP